MKESSTPQPPKVDPVLLRELERQKTRTDQQDNLRDLDKMRDFQEKLKEIEKAHEQAEREERKFIPKK
jgi:hypothetical protein